MHYKVYLDTNIYDTANYSFRNGLFTQLRNYAQNGDLELQINSVVKGEVSRHISQRIKKTARNLNQILSSQEFQLFRTIPEYENRMQTFSPSEWVDTALTEFENLLVDCKAEVITNNGIDVEGMVEDYFELRYPFEEAKKDEFPDAITVRAIAQEINRLSSGQKWFSDYIGADKVADDLIYCIVSGDNGFCTAINQTVGNRPNEDVKLFSSLNELINFFTIQDEKAAELQEKLDNGYLKALIKTTIEEGVSGAAYNVDDLDGYVDDVSNLGTDNYSYNAFVVGLQEMSNGTTAARIYVDVQYDVRLEYSFLNATESYWDKEDHAYLWTVMTDKEAVFRAETSLLFMVSISSDGEVAFEDYIEMPTDIDLYDVDMIELVSCENRDSF